MQNCRLYMNPAFIFQPHDSTVNILWADSIYSSLCLLTVPRNQSSRSPGVASLMSSPQPNPPSPADSCHLRWEAVCGLGCWRPRRRLPPWEHHRQREGEKPNITKGPAAIMFLFIITPAHLKGGCYSRLMRHRERSCVSIVTRWT